MFKNTLISLASILCFYACNRFDNQKTEKTVIKTDSLKNLKSKEDPLTSVQKTDSVVYFDFRNTIIKEEFKDSLSAKFSDLSTDDKFIITVPKGNINETKSLFQIFNSSGELIYEDSFNTYYIGNGYDLMYIKNDKEMEKYILTKAKNLVSAENFTDISDKNEIEKDEVLGQSKEDFQNYDVFIECQNDKSPLFSISLGEEDTTYIGYSKKIKKAVPIISCC